MKRTIFLLKAKYSFLFYDILAWMVSVDSWKNLRKQSNAAYQLIYILYKKSQ